MPKPRWLIWAEFLPLAMVLPPLALIPHGAALWLARWLGLGLYYLLGTYRAVSHINLRIAFGDALSEGERRACVRAAFVNMVQTFFEVASLYRLSPRQVGRLTPNPVGYDRYRAAVAEGRGVIAVSAHFGNWYWPVICAAGEGYKVNAIVRPLDNPLLDRLMNKVFERWGVRVIARQSSVTAALAALRRGETVALMVDQNAAAHGRFVPFFDVPAATMRGVALLRKGTGAEVVGVHDLRKGPCHGITMDWIRDLGDDEYSCLAAINRYFEEVISRHKEAYFWLHPRWKKRPSGEPSLYPGLRI